MNNSLPIVSLFLEAIVLPYKYCRVLLKVGLPAIIAGIGFVAYSHFNPADDPIEFSDDIHAVKDMSFIEFMMNSFPFNSVSIALYVVFYVTLLMTIVGCHRLFLLGETSVEGSNILSWKGSAIKYIGWWLKISLCVIIIAIPLSFITMKIQEYFNDYQIISLHVLNLLINLPLFYVGSRWSLVLPSAAIDKHGKSFSWSWSKSAGNGWRLTLLIVLIPNLTAILFSLLPTYDSLIYGFFTGAIWLVVAVFEVALLSVSYRYLVNTETD